MFAKQQVAFVAGLSLTEVTIFGVGCMNLLRKFPGRTHEKSILRSNLLSRELEPAET